MPPPRPPVSVHGCLLLCTAETTRPSGTVRRPPRCPSAHGGVGALGLSTSARVALPELRRAGRRGPTTPPPGAGEPDCRTNRRGLEAARCEAAGCLVHLPSLLQGAGLDRPFSLERARHSLFRRRSVLCAEARRRSLERRT